MKTLTEIHSEIERLYERAKYYDEFPKPEQYIALLDSLRLQLDNALKVQADVLRDLDLLVNEFRYNNFGRTGI